MTINSLYFENYKCFSKGETIEIRPLTILIGRNSAGKSVIARLPVLLHHTLTHPGTTPLDLHFEGLDFGASTVDLIHARSPHGAITVGAGVKRGEQASTFKAKIQHFDDLKRQYITWFEYSGRDQKLTLAWQGSDPAVDPPRYLLTPSNEIVDVTFRGLFPMRVAPLKVTNEDYDDRELFELAGPFRQARADFNMGIGSVNYLGPFRKAPARTYRFPTGVTRNVGVSGAKVADLLSEDTLRSKGSVLDAVNKWVFEKLGGWHLGLITQGDFFSIVLKKPDSPSVEINIADVGTGVAQVLPIIVQRMFESQLGRSSGLEIVEQPELHLHPAVHGDVAELYALAAKLPSTRLIVETHSENFILRVRALVAKGDLSPTDVIIYWVDDGPGGTSSIKPIHIDEDGEVDSWPTGVFSEDFLEVREIRRAQKSRKK